MQQRRQQQLLSCNMPSSNCHSWCFITYYVLTGKKQQTLFLKKNVFFWLAFMLLILSLGFTLLIMLLNNLPISLVGPLNFICPHVSIKVETSYMFQNPKLKIKFYTRWNPKWLEKSLYMTNFIVPFFSIP